MQSVYCYVSCSVRPHLGLLADIPVDRAVHVGDLDVRDGARHLVTQLPEHRRKGLAVTWKIDKIGQ